LKRITLAGVKVVSGKTRIARKIVGNNRLTQIGYAPLTMD
jgi:hypothetical protein